MTFLCLALQISQRFGFDLGLQARHLLDQLKHIGCASECVHQPNLFTGVRVGITTTGNGFVVLQVAAQRKAGVCCVGVLKQARRESKPTGSRAVCGAARMPTHHRGRSSRPHWLQ